MDHVSPTLVILGLLGPSGLGLSMSVPCTLLSFRNVSHLSLSLKILSALQDPAETSTPAIMIKAENDLTLLWILTGRRTHTCTHTRACVRVYTFHWKQIFIWNTLSARCVVNDAYTIDGSFLSLLFVASIIDRWPYLQGHIIINI